MIDSTVRLPNGHEVTVSFPEGTSDKEIKDWVLNEYVLNRDPGSIFGRSIAQGIDDLQQKWGSSLEGLGNVIDAESLSRVGGEIVANNQNEIEARRYREQQYTTESEGFQKGIDYVAGLVGQSAPQMATTLAGALAGAKIGAVGGPLAWATVPAGAFMGGFLVNMPFFYGDNRERQKEAIERGYRTEMDEGAAALTAIPQSSLDSILGAIGAKFIATPLMKIQGGILTKATKGAATGSIIETPTEFGQQLLNRYQSGLPIDDDEAIREYVDAAIGGAVLGGLFGGAGGAYSGIRGKGEVDQAPTGQEEQAPRDEMRIKQPSFAEPVADEALRYRVTYTDEFTGEEAQLELEASNPEDAINKVATGLGLEASGMQVETIFPFAEPEVAPKEPESAGTMSLDPAAQADLEARSFSLPQNLKKGKPGYRQTQNIIFASDLERAAYSATTSTSSEPGKRKRESYRNILQDAGYSSAEINSMGLEVRAQMKNQYKGSDSELFVSLGPEVVPAAKQATEEETSIPPQRDYRNVKVGDTFEIVGVNGKTSQVEAVGISDQSGMIRFKRADGTFGVTGNETDSVFQDINSPEYMLQAAGKGTRGKLIKNLYNDELDALERDINKTFEENPGLNRGIEGAGREHISDLNAIKLERRRRAGATQGPTPAPEPEVTPTEPKVAPPAQGLDVEAIREQESIISDADARIMELESEVDIEKSNIKEARDENKKKIAEVRKSNLSKEEKQERVEDLKAELQDTIDDINGNIGIYKEEISAFKSDKRKAAKKLSKLTSSDSELSVSLGPDVVAEASVTYMPKRFVGDQAAKAPPFFKSFSPEQYDEGRFVDLETKKDLSDQTFEGGSIRIEGGRPVLETSDNASETILDSKASEEGPLVLTNLFKQKAGWKWTKAPDGAPSTIVSVEQGPKHYYTLDFSSSKPLTLKTYPDKKSEPRGRPTTRGKVKLGNPVGEISIRGKKHTVYDQVTVGEDVVAQASPAGPVSTEAAIERIELEQLAPQANEDFFQFWTRVLDSTGTRFKPSSRNYGAVARKAVSDTLQFFKQNPKFATYYETDTKLTRQYVEAVVGPITESEFNLYRILVGLTSPSTKLADNVVDGLRVFKLFKDNGDFNFIVPAKTRTGQRSYDPEKTGFSFAAKTGAIKSTSILALQKKIDQLGLDGAIKYFLEPVTMEELVASKRSLGYKDVSGKTQIKEVVKQATGQDKLIPRMFMFGQKVGSYTMNTLGNVEYTTTDIWESRFIRSYFRGMLESGTGLPSGVDEQKIFQDFSTAFNKEFEKQTGQKIEPASLQAVRWFYILNAFQRTGYQYAKTDDTISGYTAKAAQKLYGIDPASGGQSISAGASQIPAGNRLFSQPLQDATSVSERYQRTRGIREQEPRRIVELDEERAALIGKAYDKMKHDPKNPEVVRAYQALVEETLAQYDAILEDGYAMELSDTEYDNSQDMIEDVRNRKVMRVFSTEDGFGTEGITAKERRENPMLAESGRTDKNGKPLLVNDIFRFVHDFFGHGKLGNGFGPLGEENAWNVHSLMFSPLARRALTTETRGQNSWVNFSGVNDKAFEIRTQARQARADGDLKKAKRLAQKAYSSMRFAEQKIGLLPEEFSESNYQEDVTSPTAEGETVGRRFPSIKAMEDFVNNAFLGMAKMLGIDIVPNYTIGGGGAQYNATRGVIEYNPRMLLNERSKNEIRAIFREEIIHAAMHNVLMKRNPNKSRNAAWLDFMGDLGRSLTQAEKDAISGVYLNMDSDVAVGSEYSRAVIQQALYGEITESYASKAFKKLLNVIKSVQSYMARVFGGDVDIDPEVAQVIRDSAELVMALDPLARLTNQKVVQKATDIANMAEGNQELTSDVVANAGKPPSKKAGIGFFKKYLFTPSVIMDNIHPELSRLFHKFFNGIDMETLAYMKRMAPFIKKFNAIKNEKDKRRLKQLIYYSPDIDPRAEDVQPRIQERRALLRKYGMLQDYDIQVRSVLNAIRQRAIQQGMDVAFLNDFFPRLVLDLDSIREYYGETIVKDFSSYIERINEVRRKELDPKKRKPPIQRGSMEEAIEFEKYIRSGEYTKSGAKPRNTKARTIEFIDDEILDAYADPGEAVEHYIHSMILSTRTMQLLGRRYEVEGENILFEKSGELGALIQRLVMNNEIDEEAAFRTIPQFARMILNPVMRENAFLSNLRSFGYLTLLVEPTSTLSNLFDLPFVMYQKGFLPTISAMLGKKAIRLEDIGVDPQKIALEFKSEKKLLAEAVRIGLKSTGFTRLDQLLKETNLNANYNYYRKLSRGYLRDRSSTASKKLKVELDFLLGEDADAAIAAFAKGDRNNALVREVVLRKILETQPLNRMEIPLGQSEDANKRMLYSMKSFQVKQLNFVVSRMLSKIFSTETSKAEKAAGLRDLSKLMFFMLLVGMPVDALKDLLAGRIGYLSDYVFNGIFRLAGVSRYTAYQVKREGVVEGLYGYFTPVGMQQIGDIGMELQLVLSGKKAITDSKLVTLAPFSDVINRLFGFTKEREMKEYKRRIKKGESPILVPPGSLR